MDGKNQTQSASLATESGSARSAASAPPTSVLQFHGGLFGALVPFFVFLVGVVWLGLSGAPDERGFWPVLILSLFLGILLSKDSHHYASAVLGEMSQPIVLLMLLGWMFAGVLGTLLAASHLVEGLIWVAEAVGLRGGGFVASCFAIAAVVSTATGTSLGTLLVCGPLLYPAGALLGSSPALLMGAILAGATFGDNVSPVSDTTIASATSQGAALGRVVASRLRYALPAGVAALCLFAWLGAEMGADLGAEMGADRSESIATAAEPLAAQQLAISPKGLPMLMVPALVIFLLLRRRPLLEGLLFGVAAAALAGPLLGLIPPSEILYIDPDQFGARGLIVDGVDRALGITVFTLLLTGLVGGLRAGGVLAGLTRFVQGRSRSPGAAERWLFVAVSLAVLLTTHSVVALLAVAPLARSLGETYQLRPERRANLLDVTVCTYPFLVPYCIPTVLAASVSSSGAVTGFPRLSPLDIGLHNFYSWGLLVLVIVAVTTGWGRQARAE